MQRLKPTSIPCFSAGGRGSGPVEPGPRDAHAAQRQPQGGSRMGPPPTPGPRGRSPRPAGACSAFLPITSGALLPAQPLLLVLPRGASHRDPNPLGAGTESQIASLRAHWWGGPHPSCDHREADARGSQETPQAVTGKLAIPRCSQRRHAFRSRAHNYREIQPAAGRASVSEAARSAPDDRGLCILDSGP